MNHYETLSHPHPTDSAFGSGSHEAGSYMVTLGVDKAETPPKTVKPWAKYVYFRQEWLEDPNLQDWLAQDPKNALRAYCKICKKSLAAHKKDLHHHAATKSHNLLASSLSEDNATISFLSQSQDDPITISDKESKMSPNIHTHFENEIDDIHSTSTTTNIIPPATTSFSPPKTKRKYTKRKIKPDVEVISSVSSPPKQSFMSQMTLEQAKSIQAAEGLLGFDLTNTLRGIGDIEIHIPMDEFSSSKPKSRKLSRVSFSFCPVLIQKDVIF